LIPVSTDSSLLCRRQLDLLAAVDALHSLDAAPLLAQRLRSHLQESVSSGLEGLAATRLISQFNDHLTRRIIDLCTRRHRLPEVAWCWLALGSEGRDEQTFVSDQDNGLLFHSSSAQEAGALRDLFLPFAQDVNRHLADCGFSLCPGKIMAGNPTWCLSLDEWREQFIEWVRRPDPEALLNASIFFDLRPLYGAHELGEQLRTLLLSLTSSTPAFQHLMAANALHAEAPLSFRGEVIVDDGGEVDLKKFGSRIFVDAARIFALTAGTRSVNTSERLRQAGKGIGLPDQEISGLEAAFSHILRLRLAQQIRAMSSGTTAGYGLTPAELNDMDQAILREALKQAKRLQQRLKLNYAL